MGGNLNCKGTDMKCKIHRHCIRRDEVLSLFICEVPEIENLAVYQEKFPKCGHLKRLKLLLAFCGRRELWPVAGKFSLEYFILFINVKLSHSDGQRERETFYSNDLLL
ncbi:hypothetical protein TNCT_469991 [Trichonephila clavata]|uniref:Uncharacterized protein n=1 Tax=Trichonephila clavata TaxID=2740835 RepID=A0A8X6L8A3_TRICU|nr:hypothetical protein TNCT_469991 [Trichonephila clavata]